ncbi:MAG: carbohydrate kinase, partial [Bacteroidales bacterium]|nr:carbohydrate kinase [Bacteroidales bacterium]
MKKIIGIGETVFDIIFKNNQPQAAVPGGSTFNSMISLGRTAAKRGRAEVLMISETGSDQVGDIIASFMEDNGVSVKAVTRAPGTQTQISLAFLDENNDAHYEFYKGCNKANLNVSIIENFDIG